MWSNHMTLRELIELGEYRELWIRYVMKETYFVKVKTHELSDEVFNKHVKSIRFQYHGNDVFVTLY